MVINKHKVLNKLKLMIMNFVPYYIILYITTKMMMKK